MDNIHDAAYLDTSRFTLDNSLGWNTPKSINQLKRAKK